MIQKYYNLTKPGIIYGNAITLAGGFLLAAKGEIAVWRLLAVLVGSSLVIACGCVFNNYIDRGIDQKMARTKKRALATGEIPVAHALVFAVLLGATGFSILALFVNWLVVAVGVVGLLDYVVLYGVAKRRSVYGTIVGSVSGATPIVAGYCAVTGRFDLGAFILFAIMVLWQMPHFYAIAINRSKDYAAASIPVLPLVQGLRAAKINIVLYIGAFTLAVASLTVFGYAGYVYLAVMLGLCGWWLWLAIRGFKGRTDARRWARDLFFFSLVVVLALAVLLSVGSILP